MSVIKDPYSHPSQDVIYIKQSVLGSGLSEEILNSCYDLKCDCSQDCISNSCSCVSKFSLNYINNILKDEKIFGDNCVFECNPKCVCLGKCSNSVTRKGPNLNLVITELGGKGYGVKAKTDLKKGTFVCEYAGEIIGETEAIKRYPKINYLLRLREHCGQEIIETFVDALYLGNIGRYLNHSCDPNCVVIPVRSERLVPKLAIFTAENIKADTELAYDYYPTADVYSTTLCLCGSSKCRTYLPSGL